MEKLISRPNIETVKKVVGRVGTRVLLAGMSLSGGVSVAHQFVNPQIAEAADCKGAIRLTVREFEDIGGVKKQYDSIIDKALSPIPDTNVKFSTGGKPIEPAIGIKADQNGELTTPTINAPCNSADGKKMEVLAEGITADGRKVSDTLFVQDGRREIFNLWVAKKEEQTTPTATATVVRTPEVQTPTAIATPARTPTATPTPQAQGMGLSLGFPDVGDVVKGLVGVGVLAGLAIGVHRLMRRIRS